MARNANNLHMDRVGGLRFSSAGIVHGILIVYVSVVGLMAWPFKYEDVHDRYIYVTS